MSVQAQSSDVENLHRMGYAQELRRRMSGFSNFAISFTIISILSGALTLYGFGMNTGGPIIMNIGWPLVGIIGSNTVLSGNRDSSPTGWPEARAECARRSGW